MEKDNNRGQWGSNFGFLMAAVGSAVGLGNLWGFPYKMGVGGGFAFLILYLALVIFVGYIMLNTELALGRKTGTGVVGAYKAISQKYAVVGWMGAIAPFLIIGFYSLLGGYCIKYAVANFGDIFGASWGVAGEDGVNFFVALFQNRFESSVYTIIFLVLSLVVVQAGITKGIEKFTKVAMPALFFMLLIIIVRSVTLPGAAEGLAFMFKPDFSVFQGTGWITVLASAGGQMFFTLSLGMGIMVAYGSYLPKEQDINKNAMLIPAADTLIAIMAGIAIMPAVASAGQEYGAGPGLLFMTLQTIFNGMGGAGAVFGFIFYVLVFIAAITSAISLLEAIVSIPVDKQLKATGINKRKQYTWIIGIAAMVEGVLVALDGLGTYLPLWFGKFCWLDGFDLLSEGILMPLGAFLTAVIFGWIRKDLLVDEIAASSEFKSKAFYLFCLKYVAPVMMLFVLIGQINSFFGLGWF